MPVKAGGIGAFTWNFAKLLRGIGDQVEVVLSSPLPSGVTDWQKPFKSLGVPTKYIHNTPLLVPKGYMWHIKAAEETAAAIDPHADVVYFAEWQAYGVHFMRSRRFRTEPGPTAVTVLHSPSKWIRQAMRTMPHSKGDLWVDFSEPYAAQHSDFVVSPGHYMLDWVRQNGWVLPPDERIAVCGLPYFPTAHSPAQARHYDASMREKLAKARKAAQAPLRTATSVARAIDSRGQSFSRVVFFGRLETRKGLELFVEAVSALRDRPCLSQITEIVLLGSSGSNRLGTPTEVASILGTAVPNARIVELTDLNTFEAQAFLAAHAGDSLVIVPSRQENYPMAVIEASLIPGLNLLCSDVGSIREILGQGCNAQLFEPFRSSLANALESTLLAGPRSAEELCSYQWQAANDRWLAFHERACDYHRRQVTHATTTPVTSRVATHHVLERMQPVAVAITASVGRGHTAIAANGEYATIASHGGMSLSLSHLDNEAGGPGRAERDTAAVGHNELDIVPAESPSRRAVDVCVTYYNLGPYLPYLLESLNRQTSQDFNLYVVDDGSTEASSREAFEQMQVRYGRPHWHFVRIENSGLSAARNHAASLGSGEYLMFVDADNVAAPNMVERFLGAIRLSGDDCLTSYLLQFDREGWADSYIHSPLYLYPPSGNSLLLGLIANEFGDANCIIRRSVFDSVRGFSTDLHKSLTGEDWEFFARLSFAGYQLDVIPEFLMYYRYRDNSLIRSTETYLNYMRVLRVYEERLSQVGLSGLAEYVAGVYTHGLSQGSAPGEIGIPHLVNHVSGYRIARALAIKIRNQVIRRLTGRTDFS